MNFQEPCHVYNSYSFNDTHLGKRLSSPYDDMVINFAKNKYLEHPENV